MGRYIYMFNSGLILLKKIVSDCYLHDLRKIILFFKYFVAIWLIYNVGLILGVQQNKSVIYIYIYIYKGVTLFKIPGHYRVLSNISWAIQ